MTARAREHLGAALLLVAVLALFFLPALVGPEQFLARDTGRLHWPMKAWIATRWAAGDLPQWNPYSGVGVPVLGGALDAALHPFNALLVALPPGAGFKSWVLLSYLLAATGAYAWARALGCGWRAGLVAGLAFALSGHLVSSSDNLTYLTTLAAIPWVFAAAQAFQARGGPARLGAVAAASALCAAGGDPQAWGLAALLAGPCALAMTSGPRGGQAGARAGLATAGALLGAAPIVLPVVLWVPHSSRTTGLALAALDHWDLPPRRLLELLVPGLLRVPSGTMAAPVWDAFTGGNRAGLPWVASIYLGVSTLLLAALAAWADRRARLLVAAAGIFAWSAMGHHAGLSRVASLAPFLDRFRYWEKMFAWPSLLLAMAAALGLERLLRDEDLAHRRLAALAAAVASGLLALRLAGGLWPAALAHTLAPASRNADGLSALAQNALDGATLGAGFAAVIALLAGLWRAPALRRVAPALLTAAAVLDPFAANGYAYVLGAPPPASRLTAALARSHELPRLFTPYEMSAWRWPELTELQAAWNWGARTLYPAWNVPSRVGNFDLYGALKPEGPSALRGEAPVPQLAQTLGIWSITHLLVRGKVANAALLGLRPPYVVDGEDPELPAALLRLPHRPRAYLARSVAAAAAGPAARASSLALDPASTDVILEGPLPPWPGAPAGEARIEVDAPERVEVATRADRPALLVLSDQHAPGWTARVDGAPVPILRANAFVRAVWVPAGAHRVEFTYRTPGLVAGLLLAGGLVLALAAWAGWRRRSPGTHLGAAAPT